MNLEAEKILVVGLQPHDAGKTTLSKALILCLEEADVNLVPFKPHAGISYWNQFDVFQRILMKGSLICSDIMELAVAAKSNFPLKLLNPVNRLCKPRTNLNQSMTEEELAFNEFVAERFTSRNGDAYKNHYYLNDSIKASQLRGVDDFVKMVEKDANIIHYTTKFQDLLDAYIKYFDEATSSCYRLIKDKPLLIESFNDAAYPFNQAEDCGIVLCVSSNIVLELESSEYFDAIESCKGEKSRLQLTVSEVYSPSLIKRKFIIQPLNNQERRNYEKLKQNYSKVSSQLIKE